MHMLFLAVYVSHMLNTFSLYVIADGSVYNCWQHRHFGTLGS